jgi:hypothetical protein
MLVLTTLIGVLGCGFTAGVCDCGAPPAAGGGPIHPVAAAGGPAATTTNSPTVTTPNGTTPLNSVPVKEAPKTPEKEETRGFDRSSDPRPFNN